MYIFLYLWLIIEKKAILLYHNSPVNETLNPKTYQKDD